MISGCVVSAGHRDGTVAHIQVQREPRTRGYPSQGRPRRRLLATLFRGQPTVDDLSYHAELAAGQPGREPAFMPAYEPARSRVGPRSAPV
jgi:hypothetical protein